MPISLIDFPKKFFGRILRKFGHNIIKLLYFLLIVSIPIMAQDNGLKNSVTDISAQLASINQQIVATYQIQKNENHPSTCKQLPWKNESFLGMPETDMPNKNQTQDTYEMIIKKMYSLEKKYENNPYVRISGFDINIGFPPSVTISIEFKK